jgi:hypothetical protein
MLGALLVAALGFSGCENDLPVGAAEKAVVLRAGDLIPYGYGLEKTEQYEKFTHIRYFDGSHELTYEYETPESEKEHALYMNVSVSVEKSTADAWSSKGTEEVAMTFGLKANGVEQREIKDFYKYGDTSSFYILEKDGNPIGNLFTVRDGKRVYVLVLSGMYFKDAAAWKELMEERLRKFSAYEPT